MNKRCVQILKKLKETDQPITASRLAEELSVSRQIIVSDVAILRASGHEIVATSRGYLFRSDSGNPDFAYVGIIACRHTGEQLRKELYTIVDYGATVIDVSVEHAIYGELSGKLELSSRYEVDQFIRKVEEEENSTPISTLTGGIHLHRIGCKSSEIFNRIKDELTEKKIAIQE